MSFSTQSQAEGSNEPRRSQPLHSLACVLERGGYPYIITRTADRQERG